MKKNGIKRVLGVATIMTAIILASLFVYSYSSLGLSPGDVTLFLAASIGSSAEVPSNPYNTLAQQLREREEELDQREKDLLEEMTRLEKQNDAVLNLIMILVGVLFFLMLINFYLDYKSRSEELKKKDRND